MNASPANAAPQTDVWPVCVITPADNDQPTPPSELLMPPSFEECRR